MLQAPAAPGITYDHLLERVRYDGAYPTREHAERAVETVLQALGRQLTGTERERLAACLPIEAALALNACVPTPETLTGWGFVKDLAQRTGATPATTRWDVGAVLFTVGRLAGETLVTDILHRLPDGYALLFGRAELTRPRTA